MSQYVDNAILARWIATSLNSSIDTLYWGGDDEAAAPELDALPRAQCWSLSDIRESESKGSIIRVKNVVFTVWGGDYSTVGGYLESIESAFINAERATTSPLSMDTTRGTILGTHLGEKSNEEMDTDIYRGRLHYEIRYQRLNQIPG